MIWYDLLEESQCQERNFDRPKSPRPSFGTKSGSSSSLERNFGSHSLPPHLTLQSKRRSPWISDQHCATQKAPGRVLLTSSSADH